MCIADKVHSILGKVGLLPADADRASALALVCQIRRLAPFECLFKWPDAFYRGRNVQNEAAQCQKFWPDFRREVKKCMSYIFVRNVVYMVLRSLSHVRILKYHLSLPCYYFSIRNIKCFDGNFAALCLCLHYGNYLGYGRVVAIR